MSPPGLTVRGAKESDAAALASLVTQLGYPTTPHEMAGRLKSLLSTTDYHVFVAESSGEVLGTVSVSLMLAIEFDAPYVRVIALAVDERARGRGIGRALMQYVEAWARAHGAIQVTLTSGAHRTGAHEFYRKLGYDDRGVRFTKVLAS